MTNPLKKGDKVKLRPDVLRRHSHSVPAHAGFTKEQFHWRDLLDKLEGKTGVVERIFPNSKHTNVQFPGHPIGIDYTELVKVPGIEIKKITQEKYLLNKEKMSITLSRNVAEIMAKSRKKRVIYVLPNGAYVVRK
jgi:hypothetical protein